MDIFILFKYQNTFQTLYMCLNIFIYIYRLYIVTQNDDLSEHNVH